MIVFAQSAQGMENLVGFLAVIIVVGIVVFALSVCLKVLIGYSVAKRNGYCVGTCIGGAFLGSYLGSSVLGFLLHLANQATLYVFHDASPETNDLISKLAWAVLFLTVAVAPFVLAYLGAKLAGSLSQPKAKRAKQFQQGPVLDGLSS